MGAPADGLGHLPAGLTTAPQAVLVARLVDDAGLFPPEELPLPVAVARHRRDAAAGHPALTNRFLVPATRLDELDAALRPEGEVFAVGVIVDTGWTTVGAAIRRACDSPTLDLALVELPVPPDLPVEAAVDALAGALPEGVAGHVEPARRPGWLDAVDVVARARAGGAPLGLKLRCGGLRRELFPSVDEVADFLAACAAAEVPFKATAGLHRAVRSTDAATGAVHHGFLNLLLATARAATGAPAAELSAVLASEDEDELRAEAMGIPLHVARAARGLLTAYGSCSTSEPIEELVRLGLARP